MLSELFVTATLSSAAISPTGSKDASVAIHTLHPSPAIKTTFKKSSSLRNCLAVSDTHVFAAQSEKAVVHVYSRERGNQEAVVPFPERIHSLALAAPGAGGVLILGTEGGRVILWEICTGRQISTSQSHLQATTTLAVDPSFNFVLSGSADSNIHLWSLPLLLSFSNPESAAGIKPLRSFTQHRAAICCACFGHGSGHGNISVSASKDGSCIVWDVQSGSPLRTFLLTSSPMSLTLDPCDRAFYVGFEDGSIQFADLFKSFTSSREPLSKRASGTESGHLGAILPSNPLYIPQLQNTPVTLSPNADRWISNGQEFGPVLCLDILFEGNYVLSGHQSGKVIMWDAAKGRVWKEVVDFQAPVTNLIVLPPIGFPVTDGKGNSKVRVHTVTKPLYESSFIPPTGIHSGAVPANYVFTAQLSSMLETPRLSAALSRSARACEEQSMLRSCIDSTSFPPSILWAGIAELAHWRGQGAPSLTEAEDCGDAAEHGGDTGDASDPRSIEHLRQSNRELWAMVNSMRTIQKSTWEIVHRLRVGQPATKAGKRHARGSNENELGEDGVGEGSEEEVEETSKGS